MNRVGGVVALALLGALAGPALADVRFEGRSGQGRLALVVAEDDGVPKRIFIRWHADCGRPRYRFTGPTVFRRPLDLNTRRRFRDGGTYRRAWRRERYTITVTIGGRKVAPRRWIGSFRARVVVRRGGRVIDRCAVRGVRWRAVRG